MEGDSFLTPRKLLQNAFARSSSRTSMASSPSLMVGTPTSLSLSSNISCNATNSRLNLLPVLHTPPSRMLKPRVVNPFEPHLADRLHLPMIGSPSLFHRPSTPHNSSISQFEWTIDEVSSLGPANVEVHETQYTETPDPAMEARVQAAISSYFKEHSIVPSPIDCQLRSQKIVMSKDSIDLSTSIAEKGRTKRRNRDGVCQTVLTFPAQLPEHVEEILKKYLTFKEDQQQSKSDSTLDESASCSFDHDARDASLRRKLFNISATNDDSVGDGDAGRLGNSLDDLDLRALSPAPDSPEVVFSQQSTSEQDLKRTRYFGSQDAIYPDDISLSPVIESDEESSFGALSPISKSSVSPSPNDVHEQYHSDADAIYRSTPEPFTPIVQNDHHSPELGTSRINGSVKHTELTNVLAEANLSNESEGNLSSSSQSADTSHRSHHSVTPLRRCQRKETRRNNRKNLSQSFHFINEKISAFEEETMHKDGIADGSMLRCTSSKMLSPIKESLVVDSEKVLKDVNFYRADSGFNEESQSQENANDLSDVSMLSEELTNTPGRKRYEIIIEGTSSRKRNDVSFALRL